MTQNQGSGWERDQSLLALIPIIKLVGSSNRFNDFSC